MYSYHSNGTLYRFRFRPFDYLQLKKKCTHIYLIIVQELQLSTISYSPFSSFFFMWMLLLCEIKLLKLQQLVKCDSINNSSSAEMGFDSCFAFKTRVMTLLVVLRNTKYTFMTVTGVEQEHLIFPDAVFIGPFGLRESKAIMPACLRRDNTEPEFNYLLLQRWCVFLRLLWHNFTLLVL